MAKKSIVDKNEKLLVRIKKVLIMRKGLSALLKNSGDDVDVFLVMKKLDKTSRSSYIKYRNRCKITGRPRGYIGKFGLSRSSLRGYISFGKVIGVKKV